MQLVKFVASAIAVSGITTSTVVADDVKPTNSSGRLGMIQPKALLPVPLGNCDNARAKQNASPHSICQGFCAFGDHRGFERSCYFITKAPLNDAADLGRAVEDKYPRNVAELCMHAEMRGEQARECSDADRDAGIDCKSECVSNSDLFQRCCGVKNVWQLARSPTTGAMSVMDAKILPKDCKKTYPIDEEGYPFCPSVCMMAKNDFTGQTWMKFYKHCESLEQYREREGPNAPLPKKAHKKRPIQSFGDCDHVLSNTMGIVNWVCNWACKLGHVKNMRSHCYYNYLLKGN